MWGTIFLILLRTVGDKIVCFMLFLRDRSGGKEEFPTRPIGLWLFDTTRRPSFSHDAKSWSETLAWCMDRQEEQYVHPQEGELSESTNPLSFGYEQEKLGKDGSSLGVVNLAGVNLVAICDKMEVQAAFKSAVQKECNSRSSPVAFWEADFESGVYYFTDLHRLVRSI